MRQRSSQPRVLSSRGLCREHKDIRTGPACGHTFPKYFPSLLRHSLGFGPVWNSRTAHWRWFHHAKRAELSVQILIPEICVKFSIWYDKVQISCHIPSQKYHGAWSPAYIALPDPPVELSVKVWLSTRILWDGRCWKIYLSASEIKIRCSSALEKFAGLAFEESSPGQILLQLKSRMDTQILPLAREGNV